jgi:hypothetical protein
LNRVSLEKGADLAPTSARQFAFPAKLVVFRQQTCPNLRTLMAQGKHFSARPEALLSSFPHCCM